MDVAGLVFADMGRPPSDVDGASYQGGGAIYPEPTSAQAQQHQERLFSWYRNRARKDYYVQGWKHGWKRGRIFADFIFTLRPDEDEAAGERRDEYHQVLVVETKGIHIKQSADTDCKRSVFDICTERASRKDWAELPPTMRHKVMRFEIVDEDEWEQRLNAMLAVQETEGHPLLTP